MLRMWLELMKKNFPRLRDLSLLSTTTEEMDLVRPEALLAPDLRNLLLHGIGPPKGFSFPFSAFALSTLSLTHIGASCYLSPGHLVTQLQCLPFLEDLSIGFAIPIPLPSSAGDLLSAPIPPVTLPTLRRFTFRGVDIYLENLVAQINTPFLERLSITLLFDLTFTLVNLTEFIRRTEGFELVVSRVIFKKDGPSIHMGDYKRGIRKLSLYVHCGPLDWQMDSATRVFSALGNVVATVEELTLDPNVDEVASDWENALEDTLWHELLLPFTSVRELHIGFSLTFQLCQALQSDDEGMVLPELQQLEVSLKDIHATEALSGFIDARESVGRRIYLLAPRGEYEDGANRLQKFLAARSNPTQKLNYVRELEDAVTYERKEKDMWRARALALEAQLCDGS
jgi:hypothetical protein